MTHRDPLHGVTLEQIVTALHARYGWDELGNLITIRCFTENPSVSSSLKFLRKTPWARAKVEELYLSSLPDFEENSRSPAAQELPPDDTVSCPADEPEA